MKIAFKIYGGRNARQKIQHCNASISCRKVFGKEVNYNFSIDVENRKLILKIDYIPKGETRMGCICKHIRSSSGVR